LDGGGDRSRSIGEKNHQYPECIFSEYTVHDTHGIFCSLFTIDTVEHMVYSMKISCTYNTIYQRYIHSLFIKDISHILVVYSINIHSIFS
jgi:hypothetical protein